jgi:hypothetical protein
MMTRKQSHQKWCSYSSSYSYKKMGCSSSVPYNNRSNTALPSAPPLQLSTSFTDSGKTSDASALRTNNHRQPYVYTIGSTGEQDSRYLNIVKRTVLETHLGSLQQTELILRNWNQTTEQNSSFNFSAQIQLLRAEICRMKSELLAVSANREL